MQVISTKNFFFCVFEPSLWISSPPKLGCFLEHILWSYFENHLQAEIVPGSPLFFDFLTVFHMIWKNQESWEIWLDGFWVGRRSKMQKLSAKNSFLHFWAAIMDLLITLKYQFLLFLIAYLEEFQSVKYYLSRISTSRSIKL